MTNNNAIFHIGIKIDITIQYCNTFDYLYTTRFISLKRPMILISARIVNKQPESIII